MAQTRPLADVITDAAARAGGEPFTLHWLMLQPGVRDAIPSEHRCLDILQQLIDEGRLRLVSRHPDRRWQEVSAR
jgi:hypothetical protein